MVHVVQRQTYTVRVQMRGTQLHETQQGNIFGEIDVTGERPLLRTRTSDGNERCVYIQAAPVPSHETSPSPPRPTDPNTDLCLRRLSMVKRHAPETGTIDPAGWLLEGDGKTRRPLQHTDVNSALQNANVVCVLCATQCA